jgi:mannose/fructose/N-acetylgalactosamine-specific phosphotransferase system component IIC
VDARAFALATLLGGLFCFERWAFLQAMFSRPLPSSVLLGAALGDAEGGLYVGVLLELLFFGKASLGAALSKHETLAATCATAFALGLAEGIPCTRGHSLLAVVAGVGMAWVGRQAEALFERRLENWTQAAVQEVQQGNFDGAMRRHLWAPLPAVVLFGFLTGSFSLLGQALAPLSAQVPARFWQAATGLYPFCAALMAVTAVRGTHARSPWKAALVGGALMALWLLWSGGYVHAL